MWEMKSIEGFWLFMYGETTDRQLSNVNVGGEKKKRKKKQ
jgi:hypothetical protein